MKIYITSIFVNNQENALRFYSEILGFIKKHDIPVGDHRWLTLVSPDGPKEIELLLEPNENPAAKTYQEALYQQGIPITSFSVEDIDAEYIKLSEKGVHFVMKPDQMGKVKIAVLDDTCGNLIQLVESN